MKAYGAEHGSRTVAVRGCPCSECNLGKPPKGKARKKVKKETMKIIKNEI